jgi:hypothetical protein
MVNEERARKLDRLGAWSGLAYLVLLLAGWAVIAGFFPPWRPSMGADQLTAMYASHTIRIRIGMVVSMLGAAMCLPFAAALTRFVARYEGRVGVLTICTAFSGLSNTLISFFPPLLWIVLVFRPRPPDVTQMFSDLAWITFLSAGTISIFLFIVPAIMAFTDTSPIPVFPRWVGWFTVWVMLGSVSGMMLEFVKTGVLCWNGLLAFYIPLVVATAWFLVIICCMARAAKAPAVSTSSADDLNVRMRI